MLSILELIRFGLCFSILCIVVRGLKVYFNTVRRYDETYIVLSSYTIELHLDSFKIYIYLN